MPQEAFGGEQIINNINDEQIKIQSINSAYVLIYQRKQMLVNSKFYYFKPYLIKPNYVNQNEIRTEIILNLDQFN